MTISLEAKPRKFCKIKALKDFLKYKKTQLCQSLTFEKDASWKITQT